MSLVCFLTMGSRRFSILSWAASASSDWAVYSSESSLCISSPTGFCAFRSCICSGSPHMLGARQIHSATRMLASVSRARRLVDSLGPSLSVWSAEVISWSSSSLTWYWMTSACLWTALSSRGAIRFLVSMLNPRSKVSLSTISSCSWAFSKRESPVSTWHFSIRQSGSCSCPSAICCPAPTAASPVITQSVAKWLRP